MGGSGAGGEESGGEDGEESEGDKTEVEEVAEKRALSGVMVMSLGAGAGVAGEGASATDERPPNPLAAPDLLRVQALMAELEEVTGEPVPETPPPTVLELAAGPRLPGAPTGLLHPSSIVNLHSGRHICFNRPLLMAALGATAGGAPAAAPDED